VANQQQKQMQKLKQLHQMQQDMQSEQEELANARVDATVGGGVVKATVTGSGQLVAISISPEVVDPDDVETLEDLVLAAVTEATRQAQELQQQKLGAATAALDAGGLGNALGGLLG
jgi:DNA-binding YbaB/EbfC family protein